MKRAHGLLNEGSGLRVLAGLLATVSLAVLGCSGDPSDPRTWAKKLGDLRERSEALDRIANMDVERARVVVPELVALYKQTKAPPAPAGADPIQGRADEGRVHRGPGLHRRGVRPGGDRRRRAGRDEGPDAVDKLIEAAERPLPIKSRANAAKLAAIRAMVKIGDKKAVPTLTKLADHLGRRAGLPAEPAGGAGAGRAAGARGRPGPDQGPVHDRSGHRHLPGVPAGPGAHRPASDRSADRAVPGEEPRDQGDGGEPAVPGRHRPAQGRLPAGRSAGGEGGARS